MTLSDGTDIDNPPDWLTHEIPTEDPREYATASTIHVADLVADVRSAFDLESVRASAPPVVQRAIDRLVVGTFHPAAAAELRELVDALRIPGLEAVIDRGLKEWERRHPPKPGRNGSARNNSKQSQKKASKSEDETNTSQVDLLAGTRWDEVAEQVAAWGALPTVRIYLPTSDRGAQQILRLKPGSIVVEIGGTGSGKTSLALEIAACHAKWEGPAGVFSLELTVPEAGARIVGQRQGVPWLDAGSLPADAIRQALAVERAHLFPRMSLADVEARIDAMIARYPGQPIMVVIDYAQILQDDITERLQFAAILERLRVMIQRTQVIAILTSQGGRGATQALRSGEKLGADTTDTGAESAQLERMSYVTLAIGGNEPPNDDGWQRKDLSIGKARMGEGDVVVPLYYHGASGRFAIAGDPERASEVKSRRIEERRRDDEKRSHERDDQRVIEFLKSFQEPLSRSRIEKEAGGKAQNIRQAIERLVTSGVLAEVGSGSRAGWRPPVVLAAMRPNASQCVPNTSPSRGDAFTGQCVPRPSVGGRGRVDASGECGGSNQGDLELGTGRVDSSEDENS